MWEHRDKLYAAWATTLGGGWVVSLTFQPLTSGTHWNQSWSRHGRKISSLSGTELRLCGHLIHWLSSWIYNSNVMFFQYVRTHSSWCLMPLRSFRFFQQITKRLNFFNPRPPKCRLKGCEIVLADPACRKGAMAYEYEGLKGTLNCTWLSATCTCGVPRDWEKACEASSPTPKYNALSLPFFKSYARYLQNLLRTCLVMLSNRYFHASNSCESSSFFRCYSFDWYSRYLSLYRRCKLRQLLQHRRKLTFWINNDFQGLGLWEYKGTGCEHNFTRRIIQEGFSSKWIAVEGRS